MLTQPAEVLGLLAQIAIAKRSAARSMYLMRKTSHKHTQTIRVSEWAVSSCSVLSEADLLDGASAESFYQVLSLSSDGFFPPFDTLFVFAMTVGEMATFM
jgi:hypothetical protein